VGLGARMLSGEVQRVRKREEQTIFALSEDWGGKEGKRVGEVCRGGKRHRTTT